MKTTAEWEQEAFALCRQILSQYVDMQQYGVFLFGSRASGKSRRNSDIDIGLIGEKPVDEYPLSLLENAFRESGVLYKVDVIDFTKNLDPDFKRIALKDIVWWNNPAKLSVERLRN